MSKAKDIARAEAGHRHVNTPKVRMFKSYVCANCHKRMDTFVKVGDYYFHDSCPKKMKPFTEEELAKRR